MKTEQFISRTARRIAALLWIPCGRSAGARRVLPPLLAGLIGLIMAVFLARGGEKLTSQAEQAVSADSAVADPAIAALRAQGPVGLQALLETHQALLANHAGPVQEAAWMRLKAALDAVGQQRDSYASKLYWFTDF